MFCLQAFIRQDDKKDIAGNSVIAHVVICANQYGTGDDHCPQRIVFRGLRAFIQYFNQVINAKPYLYEPYFFPCAGKNQPGRFSGAEADCDQAIQRNPFVVGAYQIRGLARIRQDKFDGAVEDYKTALKYDRRMWYFGITSLCRHAERGFQCCQRGFGQAIAIAPRYTRACT